MPIFRARDWMGRVFYQRCFYLFVALLVMVVVAPLAEATTTNRIAFNALQLFVLVAAVAAVGRGPTPFVAAALLALPAFGFQVIGLLEADHEILVRAWIFTAMFDMLVVGYLLQYVFREDVMTADKLYGAAAAYIMIAVLFTYLFGLVQEYSPGALSVGGEVRVAEFREIVYFSITVLTSTGFGDIVPVAPLARSLVVLEQLVGVLFTAILVARLAGVYPVKR